MAGLEDHLEGVSSVSPTEEDDGILLHDPNDETAEDEDTDGADHGVDEDSGETDEGDGRKGRTPENIYREVSRKLEKQQKENREFQERVFSMFERITENLASKSQPNNEPDNSNGDALSRYSVAQLKEMRSQVPEDKREAFEEYIVERMVQDKIEARMSAAEQARSTNEARRQTAQQAVSMYPDLLDKSSEFAREVDKELRLRGRQYAEANPHALLDVANAVAVRMGVGLRRASRPNLPHGGHATRNTDAPARKSKDELALSRERAKELAERLSGALPKGKKFDLDKLRKAAQTYTDNIDLFIR